MITEPDASGGLGSYSRDLWGVLTGALGAVAAPALGRLLDVNTVATVGTDGVVRYAATPTPEPSVADRARGLLDSPVVLIGVAVVVGGLLVLAVRK
ncbi:hypothetical protein JM946_12645 [Steroidobacter sp. S1-65]|uniref:Uncharacterized protein n=1 Tax=Steroidobacter gossypii TaxID=2805490 RepID=A0ABS1WX97_9GAMM|nr:hypothetical protein [Steroidobacter gossypii]MBM0105607.1 hypothetical protein [Steroidobacter gossypii]